MSTIHPTALIDPQAKIPSDTQVGPYAIIDGPVTLGPGCVIHAHARLIGPLTLGARNIVHSHAVLGDWPQDRKYHGEPSETIIGDDNIFREGVTVHRGTGAGTKTVIGSRCYFMVNSHVGHNDVVSDDVTLVNGALLAGHVHVAPRAIVGGNCAVHQFCRVGRLAMISNVTAQTIDVPPFCICMQTNIVQKLNAVGLRRSGVPSASINALRRMFQLLFRTHRPLKAAIADLPPDLLLVPEVQEFVEFCRTTKRGVARYKTWSRRTAESAEDREDATEEATTER